ncbi:hypothetical protein DFH08DRAFT_801337 [Mycena albidolilacea]|uniref:HAT C-terminal dimerisation domain-containing protein n=1 Tax=Mycena albidolilacea TaxID=1033008 RepID=A0AAD7EYP7_9AGAR|nr:hypothetical protein DFH08DRAFT_801337 [Mycena albidolilacea]
MAFHEVPNCADAQGTLNQRPTESTTYFVKAKWPREWIQTAEDLVRHEWNTYYKKDLTALPQPRAASERSTSRNKHFDVLYEPETTVDPLDDWISSAVIITTAEAITWWTATSTDVERAFSRGGLTVSKMRHSLSDESTRAATVIGSWINLPDTIPREKIIRKFKDKSRRMTAAESPVELVQPIDVDLDL